MPARVSIEKESIVEAAVALTREVGWQAVSARSIAARLGCSTMPIYSAIGSMEDLRSAALDRAEGLLFAEQRRRRTGDENLDLAVGYVAFAREEPRIFRFVIQGRGQGANGAMKAMEASKARLSDEVEGMKDALAAIPGEQARDDFILRSWVFAHGLAELLAAGAFAMDDREIIRHLLAAGGAFYTYAVGGQEAS